MGMGEVTVGMAALIKLLQQSRDAIPLGTFISLLKQASWELCSSTEALAGDFSGRELRDDIATVVSSFSSRTRGLAPVK